MYSAYGVPNCNPYTPPAGQAGDLFPSHGEPQYHGAGYAHRPSQRRYSRSPYHYKSISKKNTIRILTLHSGVRSDPLAGRLETAELDKCPDNYMAISYVWGDPTPCDTIDLDGRYLGLTASCQEALRKLRRKTRSLRLWVDQVCINQFDETERSHQVQLMNEIYKSSVRVLVWLGQDEHGFARTASGILKRMHRELNCWCSQSRAHPSRDPRSHGYLHASSSEWASLDALYDLPWFTRVWIVQEIGTETPATLFWGETEIAWETLAHVSLLLKRNDQISGAFAFRADKAAYLYRRHVEDFENRNRMNFVYELHRARSLHAADRRDHVFALLGHYSARRGPAGLPLIAADYTKDPESIFHEVAYQTLVRDTRSLVTLNAVQNVLESQDRGLPSWVPRWDKGINCYLLGDPGGFFKATSDERSDIIFNEQSFRSFKITGISIDVVRTASSFDYASPYGRTAEYEFVETLKAILIAGLNMNGFTLGPRYLNSETEPRIFAFVQTLAASYTMYRDMSATDVNSDGAAYLLNVARDTLRSSPAFRDAARDGKESLWAGAAMQACWNRSFVCTEGGYFVIAPNTVRQGDILCVLYGGRTPYIVRPIDRTRFKLIGECYAHGLMGGEAIEMLRAGELQERRFTIK